MKRRVTFQPYRTKSVLNQRYSAYPYLGCQHGCEFCYCREEKYYPYEDVEDFAFQIKIKENAPQLLRRGLSRAPVDLIAVGDYQPAERRFRLSRRMLEVCYELGFPVFLLERSPLVLDDFDLIRSIAERGAAAVAFSIISTPDSPGYDRVRQMERRAPAAVRRFDAMERFAEAGILTGTCFMPILPDLCDDEATLENVVRWTADHGGQFVLAGGLTLSDQQRDYFFGVLAGRFPDLLDRYRALFPPGSYGATGGRWNQIARRVRMLCQHYGLSDRMPRPIIPGDKRTLNKRVVESLVNQLYALELEGAPSYRQWAYRKAAWSIEDLEQDLGLVYRVMGRKGLESIENVGPKLAQVVERFLIEAQERSG
jgi:DNA repair photolyase